MPRKKKTIDPSFTYIAEIECNHDEIPAKISKIDGQLVEYKNRRVNNIPQDHALFLTKLNFDKHYWASSYVWDWLDTVLTPLESKVAQRLTRLGRMNTNSLEPLNDLTLLSDLSKEFDISKNKVGPIFRNLASLGIYMSCEIADKDRVMKKCWVLNPYLTFSGSIIDIGIALLFKNTPVYNTFMEGHRLLGNTKKPGLKYIK